MVAPAAPAAGRVAPPLSPSGLPSQDAVLDSGPTRIGQDGLTLRSLTDPSVAGLLPRKLTFSGLGGCESGETPFAALQGPWRETPIVQIGRGSSQERWAEWGAMRDLAPVCCLPSPARLLQALARKRVSHGPGSPAPRGTPPSPGPHQRDARLRLSLSALWDSGKMCL